MLLKLEFYKLKRRYYLVLIVLLGYLLVLFQSYAGYKESSIPSHILYVTGLDAFTSLILPVMITLFISLSFYFDQENDGTQSLILKGVTSQKLLTAKWLAYTIAAIILFFIAYGTTLVFMSLKGVDVMKFIWANLSYLLYCVMVISILVNLSFVLHRLTKSYIIPVLISIIASIVRMIGLGDVVGRLNPWGYLNRLTAYSTLKTLDFILMILLFVISSFGMFFLAKSWNLRRRHAT